MPSTGLAKNPASAFNPFTIALAAYNLRFLTHSNPFGNLPRHNILNAADSEIFYPLPTGTKNHGFRQGLPSKPADF